jgi:HK97 family phage prohead protease
VDAATFDRALAIVMHRKLIGHEAAHAAAAIALGLPVREVVVYQNDLSEPPADPTEAAGFAMIGRPDSVDGRRKGAIALMAGRLEEGAAYWPPTWPFTQVPEYGDESDLIAEVNALELDERSYGQLVADAYKVCASHEYNRLHAAIGHALERHGRLDELALERIKAIVTEGATVEHKVIGATTVDTDTELGTFTAIVSAWDVDRERDEIAHDAFDKTIAAWQGSGKNLPLLFEHSTETVGAIDPHSMRPTDAGLLVAGEVDRSTEKGQQTWRQIKAGTAGFSIGYMAKSIPREGGGRRLLEIDLLEISATSTPMHPATRALSWKSAGIGDDRDVIELADQIKVERVGREFAETVANCMSGADGGDPLRAKSERIAREFAPIQVASFEC